MRLHIGGHAHPGEVQSQLMIPTTPIRMDMVILLTIAPAARIYYRRLMTMEKTGQDWSHAKEIWWGSTVYSVERMRVCKHSVWKDGRRSHRKHEGEDWGLRREEGFFGNGHPNPAPRILGNRPGRTFELAMLWRAVGSRFVVIQSFASTHARTISPVPSQ